MATVKELLTQASDLKNAGDIAGAVGKFNEVLGMEPDHVLAHSSLAVYLQKLGDKEAAVAHAKRVTELEPNDPFSFTQLSVICQRCGLIPEAEEAMATARMMEGRAGHRH